MSHGVSVKVARRVMTGCGSFTATPRPLDLAKALSYYIVIYVVIIIEYFILRIAADGIVLKGEVRLAVAGWFLR